LFYQASDKGLARVCEGRATLKPQGGGSAGRDRVKAGAERSKDLTNSAKRGSDAERTEPQGEEIKSISRNNSNLARTASSGKRQVAGIVSKEAVPVCFICQRRNPPHKAKRYIPLEN